MEIKDIWQAIIWRMNERKILPAMLASETGYPLDYIIRGIAGQPVEVELSFLRGCVRVFRLMSGQTKIYEEAINTLSYDECIKLIKPPPEMPPRQGNFWDWDE